MGGVCVRKVADPQGWLNRQLRFGKQGKKTIQGKIRGKRREKMLVDQPV